MKALLYAVIFMIVGLVSFALLAPFIFTGDFKKIGALAAPVIVVVFGAAGLWFGLNRQKKS
jgi:hypothetical protein